MIHLINVFDKSRYERMKKVGHNLVFKGWMLSVESRSALAKQFRDVITGIGVLIASPFVILFAFLTFLYMLLPKVFISKEE